MTTGLASVLILAVLATTVTFVTEQKAYAAVENITVRKGQEFPIILESNPTTGYQWIPTFNTSILKLVSHSFEPATTKLMGSTGTDIFKFKAIGYGKESLKMFYKRSWEKEIAKEEVFVINVR
jgi:inhibitor of cysteine peptidase